MVRLEKRYILSSSMFILLYCPPAKYLTQSLALAKAVLLTAASSLLTIRTIAVLFYCHSSRYFLDMHKNEILVS